MKLLTSTLTASRVALRTLFSTITSGLLLVSASAQERDYREARVYVTAPPVAAPITTAFPAPIPLSAQLLTDHGFFALAPLEEPDEDIPTIIIDDQKTFQTILGFGGAFTDAAASVFARLSQDAQEQFLKACFDPVEGNGYTLCRTTIHSCDYSSDMYTYDDTVGDKELKNIVRPVRVYSLASGAISPSTAPAAETPKPSGDQPSIAVLPFTCFSEEGEFKFLAEAMTEDLITMLARITGFIVIARQSSFAYQGRSVDSRQIGRELGVRYIVEGSLRPVGQQLRVGTQLIDATNGAQLWADRFDGQAENVLEL